MADANASQQHEMALAVELWKLVSRRRLAAAALAAA